MPEMIAKSRTVRGILFVPVWETQLPGQRASFYCCTTCLATVIELGKQEKK